MAKKKTESNSIAQPPAVVLREGKWVTADGLCFNTATKAWKHVQEMREAIPETAQTEQNSTQNQNE